MYFTQRAQSPQRHKKLIINTLRALRSLREKTARTIVISFEALKKGDVDTALKRVQASKEKTQGIYRGWMLRPEQYKQLYEALLKKNIELINTPNEYKFCHYLPENYETIKAVTPKTTFKPLTSDFDIKDFEKELNVFGNQSIVVKDYVKSQKHYWTEACFIPDASDRQKVEAVIRKFIELQDVDLNEGLVFRQFVALEQLTNRSQSDMPFDEGVSHLYQGWRSDDCV